jgi:hypothetical protein
VSFKRCERRSCRHSSSSNRSFFDTDVFCFTSGAGADVVPSSAVTAARDAPTEVEGCGRSAFGCFLSFFGAKKSRSLRSSSSPSWSDT